jgi:putative addiction module killer protein
VQILEYLDAARDSPYRDWFESLNAEAAAKVTVALTRIELGNLSNVKGVGAGVQEFRIDFGPGYRVYFGRDGDFAGGRHKEPPAERHRDGAEAMGRLQEAQEWLRGQRSPWWKPEPRRGETDGTHP